MQIQILIFERTPDRTALWTTIGPYSGTLEEARTHMEERYARDHRDGVVQVTRKQVALVEVLTNGAVLHTFDVKETIRLVSS